MQYHINFFDDRDLLRVPAQWRPKYNPRVAHLPGIRYSSQSNHYRVQGRNIIGVLFIKGTLPIIIGISFTKGGRLRVYATIFVRMQLTFLPYDKVEKGHLHKSNFWHSGDETFIYYRELYVVKFGSLYCKRRQVPSASVRVTDSIEPAPITHPRQLCRRRCHRPW